MDITTLVTGITPSRSATFTATVIIAGIGIVLFTLFVLILVFYAFGAIVSKTQGAAKKNSSKKAETKAAAKSAPAPAVSAPKSAPAVQDGISGEVVAAISAAVYAMEGENATVCSIQKQPQIVTRQNPITTRNPWAQAAVIDNTRPF